MKSEVMAAADCVFGTRAVEFNEIGVLFRSEERLQAVTFGLVRLLVVVGESGDVPSDENIFFDAIK